MKFIKFIREFLKNPKEVGAVAESSPFLARKMAQHIGQAINIVEFGPGTGSVTTEILRHMPKNSRLTCLEINPNFCERLRKIKDSRLKIVNDDIQNCSRYVERPDCILSGLPLANFNNSEKEKIFALTSKSQTYIQFQYNPFLRPKLKRYFKDVKVKFVPLNIPPAFVYISKNPRSEAERCEFNNK
ncbi:MAG: SAM-dependent methyltransferase [Phycisphaerae bacterium]|jgi:phospholipid N-methyltransferase